jgi:hypothetical protein
MVAVCWGSELTSRNPFPSRSTNAVSASVPSFVPAHKIAGPFPSAAVVTVPVTQGSRRLDRVPHGATPHPASRHRLRAVTFTVGDLPECACVDAAATRSSGVVRAKRQSAEDDHREPLGARFAKFHWAPASAIHPGRN